MADIPSSELNLLRIKGLAAFVFQIAGAVGVFYCIWKDSYNAAIWCLVLEVACAMVLYFGAAYLKNQLHVKFRVTHFRASKIVGIILMVSASIAFIVHVVFLIIEAKDKKVFEKDSRYVAPIAFVAAFWSLMLFFDARKYEAKLTAQGVF